MQHPDPRRDARLADYGTAAASLALLSDRRLRALVDGATPVSSGIGGTAAELTVEGVRVFVKKIALTELEQRPANVRSTANLFGLPTYYQYGVGSAGFGAWRELAVHAMTTAWVLAGAHPGFPLMYHWRVLPDTPAAVLSDFADVAEAVEYWAGSPAVRRRLDAIGAATSSVVLFLEHIPRTLGTWLAERDPAADAGAAYARVERDLMAGTAFLRSRGVIHFDAHFDNILTDGASLYFADFGLATSSGFELSPEEADFFARHRDYDRCLTTSQLVRSLAGRRTGAEGRRTEIRAGPAASIVERHAPVAAVIDRFHRRLLTESRRAPYPAAEIEQACAPTSGAH